jgi:hypothetical protein
MECNSSRVTICWHFVIREAGMTFSVSLCVCVRACVWRVKDGGGLTRLCPIMSNHSLQPSRGNRYHKHYISRKINSELKSALRILP